VEMTNCKYKKIVIIPGATHLFEERGALEKVAEEAKKWCVEWLVEEREGSQEENVEVEEQRGGEGNESKERQEESKGL